MSKKPAVSCFQLLEKASHPLLERARELQRLEKTVLGLLPANLAPHCKVLNLKNETLILGAGSSAWAARIRFAAPELIMQLQRHFSHGIRAVQVRIQPPTRQIKHIAGHKLTISMDSGELLARTARTIDDPGLQEALYRIAAKAREI